MNGKDMGYAFEQFGFWGDSLCPQWVEGEQFYNCENFTAMLSRKGFSFEKLFSKLGFFR